MFLETQSVSWFLVWRAWFLNIVKALPPDTLGSPLSVTAPKFHSDADRWHSEAPPRAGWDYLGGVAYHVVLVMHCVGWDDLGGGVYDVLDGIAWVGVAHHVLGGITWAGVLTMHVLGGMTWAGALTMCAVGSLGRVYAVLGGVAWANYHVWGASVLAVCCVG